LALKLEYLNDKKTRTISNVEAISLTTLDLVFHKVNPTLIDVNECNVTSVNVTMSAEESRVVARFENASAGGVTMSVLVCRDSFQLLLLDRQLCLSLDSV
jgi:hypothetical protein